MDSLEFDRVVCAWCDQELPAELFRPGRKVCRPCNTARDTECMRRRRAMPSVADPKQNAARLPFGKMQEAFK